MLSEVPHKESDRSALKPAVPATIQANSPKPPTRTAVRGRLDADLESIGQMCAFVKNAIDVGSDEPFIASGSHCIRRLVVSEDEDDVGPSVD